MKISIPKERRPDEFRVAASPDTVKKFIALGFDVVVEGGAGAGAAIPDSAFADAGAAIAVDAAAAFADADMVLKIQRPLTANDGGGPEAPDELALMKKGAVLIGTLGALANPADAVAYADAEHCGAPELDLVVAAAIETGCAGVLIDTWDKTAGGLRDHVSMDQLESVRERTAAAGLLLALAGKVSLEDLPEVTRVQPDLVAVRSAACRDGRRDLEVEADRVRELADRLGCASVSVAAWRHAG